MAQITIPIACDIPQKSIEQIPYPEMSDGQFVDMIDKRVLKTITDYDLFTKDNTILVAASGGKDSTMLLSILKQFGFDIEAVTVDAHIGCYTQENLANLRKICEGIDVKLHEISFKKEFGGSLCHIRDTINDNGNDLKSCSICGVFRRWLINKKAKELNPHCVAFGHNLDDEAQAFFMNVIKNNVSVSARMGPTTSRSNNHKLVPRVKPLYFVSEKEVIRYVKVKKFPVHVGKCPCSVGGQRNFIKDLFNELEKESPHIKKNILDYFMKRKKVLVDQFKGQTTNSCKSCGEPSSKIHCRTCQLMAMYKEPAKS